MKAISDIAKATTAKSIRMIAKYIGFRVCSKIPSVTRWSTASPLSSNNASCDFSMNGIERMIRKIPTPSPTYHGGLKPTIFAVKLKTKPSNTASTPIVRADPR